MKLVSECVRIVDFLRARKEIFKTKHYIYYFKTENSFIKRFF